MDHKDRFFIIHHKYHLEISTALILSPYQPFFVFDPARIRVLGAANDPLGIFRCNAMFSDVFDIPVVPTELHYILMQENLCCVNE